MEWMPKMLRVCETKLKEPIDGNSFTMLLLLSSIRWTDAMAFMIESHTISTTMNVPN